jgi:hypothetical protein
MWDNQLYVAQQCVNWRLEERCGLRLEGRNRGENLLNRARNLSPNPSSFWRGEETSGGASGLVSFEPGVVGWDAKGRFRAVMP